MQYVHLDRPPGLLLDLNPAEQRLINDRRKRNHVVAGGTRRLCELLDYGLVHTSRRGNNVEIRQHGRAVDTHIERAGAGGAEESLREMQPHRVA
jgi:hypothetical protein